MRCVWVPQAGLFKLAYLSGAGPGIIGCRRGSVVGLGLAEARGKRGKVKLALAGEEGKQETWMDVWADKMPWLYLSAIFRMTVY